jgi:hypothetical protein
MANAGADRSIIGIETRERVRQIIASDFRECTKVRDLPELGKCAKLAIVHLT